jgi:hypothetical protein
MKNVVNAPEISESIPANTEPSATELKELSAEVADLRARVADLDRRVSSLLASASTDAPAPPELKEAGLKEAGLNEWLGEIFAATPAPVNVAAMFSDGDDKLDLLAAVTGTHPLSWKYSTVWPFPGPPGFKWTLGDYTASYSSVRTPRWMFTSSTFQGSGDSLKEALEGFVTPTEVEEQNPDRPGVES